MQLTLESTKHRRIPRQTFPAQEILDPLLFPAENQSLAVKSRGRKGFGPEHSVSTKGGELLRGVPIITPSPDLFFVLIQPSAA